MSADEYASGPVWVCGGFVFFTAWDHLLRQMIPLSARNTNVQSWKWKNTAVSLVHSIITGCWSLLCFYEHPKLGEDLIKIYTRSSHMLVSFSVGYFMHDFLDMALHHRKRSSYELMVHHLCVIACFGLSVWTRMFVGYAVVALFVEVNSIFLHIRQLFNITGIGKKEPKYRLNSMLNIGTFVIFRIAVLGWMTRWLVIHKDDLSLAVYTLGSVGLAIIMVMSIVLFLRVCIADFTKKAPKDSNMHHESNHKKAQECDDSMKLSSAATLLPNGTNIHLD